MKIAIVEDDKSLLQNISKALDLEGYETIKCVSAEEAQFYIEANDCDAIILDRMLPGMSGLDLLKIIRNKKISTPVIVLTALDTVEDRIDGLDCGADDYLSKPFDMRELFARIRAIDRRPKTIGSEESIKIYDLSYSHKAYLLEGPNGKVTLTRKTGDMLMTFLSSESYTVSRAQLFNKVWGLDSDVEEGNIDSYIYFLRKKLAEIGSAAQLINRKGIGYCLTHIN